MSPNQQISKIHHDTKIIYYNLAHSDSKQIVNNS